MGKMKRKKKGKKHAIKFKKTKGRWTEYQQRFVEAYLLDPNATQAAVKAGYSKRTAYSQGQRLLKHVEVSREIAKRRKEREARSAKSGDDVIAELEKLAFTNMTDILEFGPNGVRVKDSDTLPAAVQAAIESVQESRDKDGNVTSIRIKLHDKKGSLELLGKHLGVIKDKVEHDITERTRIVCEFYADE